MKLLIESMDLNESEQNYNWGSKEYLSQNLIRYTPYLRSYGLPNLDFWEGWTKFKFYTKKGENHFWI